MVASSLLIVGFWSLFRPCNFEVVGVNGETTGLIECDSGETANDWLHTIQATINTLNSQAVSIC